jgi:hypothetical protein
MAIENRLAKLQWNNYTLYSSAEKSLISMQKWHKLVAFCNKEMILQLTA